MIAVMMTATMGPAGTSRAQQPVNFGPSPYGGPPHPEYLVPPGTLGGFFAVAKPNGIFYDTGKLQSHGGLGTPLFRFMRAHEYVHILRGHVVLSPQHYFMNELDADCQAARLFGWNSDEVRAIVATYQWEVPPYDMPAMPGSERRKQNMRECGGG